MELVHVRCVCGLAGRSPPHWCPYPVIGAELGDESFPVAEVIVDPVVTRDVEVGQDPGLSGHLHLIMNIWTKAHVQMRGQLWSSCFQTERNLIKSKCWFE